MATLRKSTRLKGWDYSSASAYHVTFCTEGRRCLLGTVSKELGIMMPSYAGLICARSIETIRDSYEGVDIPVFCIMPNHVHLLVINEQSGGTNILSLVNRVKGETTREIRKRNPGAVVWQRGFHDHIIRGEVDYLATWKYIEDNPAKWADDEYYNA